MTSIRIDSVTFCHRNPMPYMALGLLYARNCGERFMSCWIAGIRSKNTQRFQEDFQPLSKVMSRPRRNNRFKFNMRKNMALLNFRRFPSHRVGGGRQVLGMALLVQIFGGNVHLVIPDDSSALNMGGKEKVQTFQRLADRFFQQGHGIEGSPLSVCKTDKEGIVWSWGHCCYNPMGNWHRSS